MKKNIIISVICLILGTFLGINKDLLTDPVTKVYCSLQPQECK